MWVRIDKLVGAGLLVWGCGTHVEGRGVCSNAHTVTKPTSEATQFGETGGELVDSVSGTHVVDVPSESDPDRKLTVVVAPVPGAEVTEEQASASPCKRTSVPVHLSLQLDDGSIVGELDGEALLQYEGDPNQPHLARSVGGKAPLSAFTSFPPGEYPELVITYLAIEADGGAGTGSVVTREDRQDTNAEQPTLRGREVLTW